MSDCDCALPSAENHFLQAHVDLLGASLNALTGKSFPGINNNNAEAVFNADFALLSHNTAADPTFNYANRTALDLFELDWSALLSLPSRYSAESGERGAREAFMQRVREHGFVDDYSGVRISSRGQRFMIKQAVVWNVVVDGVIHGQAAMFSHWQMLDTQP